MSNTLLYVIAVLIWGSTWFAIEFQLGVVEPEVSVSYRYGAAALILFIWCKIKRIPLIFDLKYHYWFALMGLLMFCLNYVFAYRAQIYITSALSAIVFTSMVWMNIINARLFFGVRVSARVYLGALIGISGIVVLFGPRIENFSFSDGVFFGCVLAFCGALMASFGNMASQAAQRAKLPVVSSNAWSMLYGCLFTTVIAISRGEPFTFDFSPG